MGFGYNVNEANLFQKGRPEADIKDDILIIQGESVMRYTSMHYLSLATNLPSLTDPHHTWASKPR